MGVLKDRNMSCGGGGWRDRQVGQFPTTLTNMDKVLVIKMRLEP